MTLRGALAWLSEWAPLIWTVASLVALARITWIGRRLLTAYRRLRTITETDTSQSRAIRRVGLLYGALSVFLVALIYIGADPLLRPHAPGVVPALLTLVVLLSVPPMLLVVAEWVWRMHRD